MKKSTKVRIIIFDILIEIYKKNKNFDELFNSKAEQFKLDNQEKAFIFNVCLNTMRYNIHSKIILNNFVKKKLKNNQYILLISAITQLVFLNIKSYAVVNESVEVAKKIGIFPSFINAVLKKIAQNIQELKKTTINKSDLPEWFQKEIQKQHNLKLDILIKTYFFEPSLHLVFKSNRYLKKFSENYVISSNNSAFISSKKKVSQLNDYNKGYWWVQNFSSMLPILLGPNLKNKSILDLCAAPGGKAFQVMLENNNIILNDISKKRISKLKENLARLNFSAIIKNYNALNFPEDKRFDIIILDAPCSSIGTIRSNPEIFFKNKGPDFKSLHLLQEKMLKKSAQLLKTNGVIIYMVCSFFFSETIKPINEFLNKNKNFSILKYNNNYFKKDLNVKSFFTNEGYFLTLPTIYKEYKIDGFFAIQLIKND